MPPRRTTAAITLALAGCLVLAASAQSGIKVTHDDSVRVLASLKREARDNFTKWKRIVIYCRDEGADVTVAGAICAKAFSDVALIGAATGLPVDTTRSAYAVGMISALTSALVVQINIWTYSSYPRGGGPVAASVEVTARTSVHAVTNVHDGPTVVDTATRHGELVLWQRSLVGADPSFQSGVAERLADGTESALKEFLTEFLEARRSPQSPSR